MVGPLVALVALEEGRERFGPNTDPMRRDGVGAVDDVVADAWSCLVLPDTAL